MNDNHFFNQNINYNNFDNNLTPPKKNISKTDLIIILVIILSITILILFLLRKPTPNYFLDLIGSEEIIVYQNYSYVEPGFNAYDKDGTNYNDEVIVDGNINTDIAGEYLIKYQYQDIKKERKVVVVAPDRNLTYLILRGNEIIYLEKGEQYIEPGYDVLDSNDSDLKQKVVIEGEVDTNKSGTYKLLYSVTNSQGKTLTKERTIVVVSLTYNISLEENSKFVKSNNIIFNTSDNNYQYILLPDGVKTTSRNISYKITDNGTYTFKIYNILGNYEEETFTISNIDKFPPTGTCDGYLYDDYTTLKVNAKDDTFISSYEYYYGSKKSNKTSNNEYTYTDKIDSSSVNIYDQVNNKTTIKCQMHDYSTKIESSYKSYKYKDSVTGRTMNYWLYIPENATKRKQLPLVVYMHGDGGRGTNINDVTLFAYPKFILEGTKYPFMLLAPQISKDTNWTDKKTYQTLMSLINKITSEYSVNKNKIILSGGSSGGGGVYVIAAAYPNFFAGAVVGSGIYNYNYRNLAKNLRSTPMWIFHGTNDASISYSGVKSLADSLKSNGVNVKFVGIEGGTHSVTETDKGFKNPELINWILAQERK